MLIYSLNLKILLIYSISKFFINSIFKLKQEKTLLKNNQVYVDCKAKDAVIHMINIYF